MPYLLTDHFDSKLRRVAKNMSTDELEKPSRGYEPFPRTKALRLGIIPGIKRSQWNEGGPSPCLYHPIRYEKPYGPIPNGEVGLTLEITEIAIN